MATEWQPNAAEALGPNSTIYPLSQTPLVLVAPDTQLYHLMSKKQPFERSYRVALWGANLVFLKNVSLPFRKGRVVNEASNKGVRPPAPLPMD